MSCLFVRPRDRIRLILHRILCLKGDIMEALANFFESINKALGVKGPSELIFHPVFIGSCVIAFIYFVIARMKYFALAVGGLMGGSLVVHYLYPTSTQNLSQLIQFLGALGVLALVLVYVGFVRD